LNRWVVFTRKTSGQVFEPTTPPFAPEAALATAPALAPQAKEARTTAAISSAASAAALSASSSVPAAETAVVPMEKGSLASAITTAAVPKGLGPATKYESSEIFRFSPDAKLVDSLKIGDKSAVRWLAPYAPFPIIDDLPSGGQVKYPTLEHYLVGMKYKIATDRPQLASSVFSEEGTIHQKFLRDRLAASGKKPLTEDQDQEFLRQEMAEVRIANRASNIKKYRAQFDEASWASNKDEVLQEGLRQRWERDARLHAIVEAARAQSKYLLYDTDAAGMSELGGVRKMDGRIEGENKVGRILMQLAGYPGF
jgi:predicted NAD-dependent protein-ADP-ribosyltransferase YbiA (DUF1768 family)